ncbi:MAG: hypothetical protein RMM17_07365 [Acidobacteriota bacterium]|nr:hypothetical protein [Blastocatellia bacterium]MDW8412484.1 hypothetical protein [Acidobacteriota bacterium]
MLAVKRVLSLLFLILAVDVFAQLKSAESEIEKSYHDKFEDDPEERAKWFYSLRAYPYKSIPSEARRRAWETRTRVLPQQAEGGWVSIGPAPTISAVPNNWKETSGRINAIAVSPANSQLVLVGASTGGIWRSTDGGVTFLPVSDDQVDLAVGAIAFAPTNPNIVYAGMGDIDNGYFGSGVLKSTDAGLTWQRVNDASLPSRGWSADIAVDPTDPNRVYLAQYARLNEGRAFSSGFYISTNGGVTWTRTLGGLPTNVVIDPRNSNVLYLAVTRVDDGSGAAGIFRSTDRGQTWRQLFTTPYGNAATYDIRVAVSAANTNVIYGYTGGILQGRFDVRVVVSKDGGNQWVNLGSREIDTGQFGYNTYLQVDPRNADIVYVGSRDVYKSTNGGVNFTNLNNSFTVSGSFTPGRSNAHPDQHCLAFDPRDSNIFYIGGDGGIYKTTDGGRTFASLNQTLTLQQTYGITLHPLDRKVTYIGTQDNGFQVRIADKTWRELFTGDYGTVVINPKDTSAFVTNYVRGDIFLFRNNSFAEQVATNSTFGESSNPRIAFIAPLVGNGVDERLYFGTWRLFVSPNFGRTWQAPAGDLDLTKGNRDVLNTIAVSSSNPDVIYTGSAQGRAMVSRDGGKTWTDITAGLPNRAITDIEISSSDPATAFLTVSGYGSGHIFKTTDFGATWKDVSSGVPDIPANAVKIDPIFANIIYLGTDIGCYRSTNGGETFTEFNFGLPPVVVADFASQSSGLVQLSTYGRGVYELVTVADTEPPKIEITSPAGGEVLQAGSSFSIAWNSSDNFSLLRHDISLSTDAGVSFPITIASGLAATAKTFNWSVPQLDSNRAVIRVTATDQANNSASADSRVFTIKKGGSGPTVKVIAPKGGEELVVGSNFSVEWTIVEDVAIERQSIELSTDGGTTFPITIVSGLAGNVNKFTWRVADVVTETAVIRVSAVDTAGREGKGNSAVFHIVRPDFALFFAPDMLKVSRGQKGQLTVNIRRTGGFADTVTITAPNTSAFKVKLTPSQVSTNGNAASFNFTVKKKAPLGTQQLVFSGKDPSGRVREAVLQMVIE